MPQKSKIFRIIKRVLIWLAILPLALIGILTLVLACGPLQRMVCSKVSDIISASMGTRIEVKGLFVNPFTRHVSVSGVYIEDLRGDTLAYLGSMDGYLSSFSAADGEFTFSSLTIDSLKARLTADSSGTFNYERVFGISADSAQNDDTPASPFKIEAGLLRVMNSEFTYQLHNDTAQSPAMDFGNLQLTGINIDAWNLAVGVPDITLSADIYNLTAREHCGMSLEQLKARLMLGPAGMRLGDMSLKCPDTDIEADSIVLKYTTLAAMSQFMDSVRIEASIREGSRLGLDDIGHIVPDIYGYGISPEIKLCAQGPVSNLRISGLDIKYGSGSRILADAYIKGMPDISNLAFNINLRQAQTCQSDLMTLHQPCDSTPLIDLPNITNGIGNLSISAQCKGTSQNCQMTAKLESKLGNVDTHMEYKGNGKTGQLTGFMKAEALNLGAISGDQKTMGMLSTHDSLVVNFEEDGRLNGYINGTVDSLGLMGYYYHHIKMDGLFTEQSFDGKLSIKDPCLDLDFDGILDVGRENRYSFMLDVNYADLKTTHILDDSIDRLSFGLAAQLTASNIDNINGVVQLTNIMKFERDNQTLYLNNFKFTSIVDHYICGLPERTFTLRSDFVDATLSGRTHSMQVLEILSNFAYMILPSLDYQNKNIFNVNTKPKVPTKLDYDNPEFMRFLGNKFDFSVAFHNMNRLTRFVMPELQISNNTVVEGGFHTLRKNSWVTFKTDKIKYNEYSADSLRISAKLINDQMDIVVKSDSIILSDDMKLKHPQILASARHDTLAYAISWNNTKDEIRNEGNIMGDFVVSPHPRPKHFPVLTANLYESNFWTWNKEWTFHPARAVIDSTSVTMSDFLLKHEDQFFQANGTISCNPEDVFQLKANNFDLQLLNHFLGNNTIAGHATGYARLMNVYGDLPLIELKNNIDTLKINDVTLGPFNAECNFQPGDSVVSIDFYTMNKMHKKNLHGFGYFDFTNKEIDFSFDIGNLSSRVLRPLFQNYLTVPSTQFLDGMTHVKGPVSSPEIISRLKLKGGYFKIDYLGAKYTIQDALNIVVDNRTIRLEKVKLLSGQTGLAYLEGTIDHQNFDKFKMDVNLQLKNFTLLNTPRTDSAAFWGKAYASGNVRITGDPTRMINIDAKVRTDKNTQVFLPLYGASEVSNDFNFVTFKNPADTMETEIHRQKADLSDIRMNFNLEVTPDAEVQAILDETTGNILKAAASGNLKLDVTGSGDFNMYGTLAVERGDYLFTMSNVLSKKFEVVKGGTLRWNGDPLDAEVDLSAMYRLRKVNLYNLMVDETYRDKKVPVQCLLKMKGNIMTPEISFGVKIEDNGGVAQGQIDNLDEGNINKQMISLLLLNQFQPLPGLRSSENSMFSDFNAGEIVTNKINSMLSDISDKFDVGVNYQMGDGASAEELDVAVSTQLFDDRVSVSTNLGVQGDGKNQTNRNTNGVVGEVEVEVKLNKSGSMKLNVYNKANEDELQESPYKQGIGFSFKKEFDTLKELWRSLVGRKKED